MKKIKNKFLVFFVVFFLFSCANPNILSPESSLPDGEKGATKEEEKENNSSPESSPFGQKERGYKNEKNEEKINEEQEEVEKKIIKKDKLFNFSGSFEEKIKDDLENIIVENSWEKNNFKNTKKIENKNNISAWINDKDLVIEGKIMEIYETKDFEIKYKNTKISYKIKKDNKKFFEFSWIIKNKNNLIIKWKSLIEIDKIIVHFDNKKTKFPESFYTLKQFDYWDENFSYKAWILLKNLDLGLNEYKIMAYIWEEFSIMNLEINIENLDDLKKNNSKIKIWKYCLLDSCLEEKYWKIEETEKEYIQKLENWNRNYLFKNKSFWLEILWVWKKEKKVFTNKVGNFYIRTHYKDLENFLQIRQEVFNKDWEKILYLNQKTLSPALNSMTHKGPKSSLPNREKGATKIDFDKKIFLGNYSFKLNFNIKNNIWKNILFTDNKEYKNTWEIKKFIEENVEETKKIFTNYIFLVDSEKQIYINYSWNFEKPERIIFLWNDEKWLSKNINANWELLDIELSNKILSYFWINSEKNVTENGEIIFEISEKNLPVFIVKRFNNSWKYMLYLVEKYSFSK